MDKLRNEALNAILDKLGILSKWSNMYDEDLSKGIKKTKEQLEEVLEL